MSLPDPIINYTIQTLQFLTPSISISAAADGVDSSIINSGTLGTPVNFTVTILPADDIVSLKSFVWDFGDGTILNEPPPIREEYLFPETRGSSEDCEDLFTPVECSFEPKHGSGGTPVAIIPDASIASPHPDPAGVPYLSPAGLIRGMQTCTISSGILTASVGTPFTGITNINKMNVILRFVWKIIGNSVNTFNNLTSVFGPTVPFRKVPYRFYIEDAISGGNKLYADYGYFESSFIAPNANWTTNQYTNQYLVIYASYPILSSPTSQTLNLGTLSGVPDSASPVWYNITSGSYALQGYCTITSGVATVDTTVATGNSSPYYVINALKGYSVQLSSRYPGGNETTVKKLITSNTADTFTLGVSSVNLVPDGKYSFALDTCEPFFVMGSTEALYSLSFQLQSEIDIVEYINAGINKIAFGSGEILIMINSIPGMSENMYTVTVARQALYKDLYYTRPHYAGEIARIISWRGYRGASALSKVNMAYNRSSRYNDPLSVGYAWPLP